jgi:uncharacterized protein (TIGR02453 family)
MGIPLAALDFYEDLGADNSKSFWTAHKQTYDESVKAPVEALAAELADEFGPGKFFRPYRDVRFAKDKTPYKDHQGVYFAESARYFHVSAEGLYVGGGYFGMAADQLGRYRRSVDNELLAVMLDQALASARASKLDIGGETLTRIPSGFAKDHHHADLIRHKSLLANRQFGSPAWLTTKRTLTETVKALRAMEPLIDWLRTNVGVSDQPGRH